MCSQWHSRKEQLGRAKALTQERQLEVGTGCGHEENPPTPLSGVAPPSQFLAFSLTFPPLS